MSSVMRPVGPQPPNVYWRRRVLAAVLLVIVLALAIWLIKAVAGAVSGGNQPTAGKSVTATPAATASGTPTGSDSPTASAGATDAAACGKDSLGLDATSAAKTIKAGTGTTLGVTIANIGQTPCSLDAGAANLELLISSGAERIWSSDDCKPAGEHQPLTVQPGEKLQSKVKWDGVRSAPECPTTGLATLKSGTYQLKARVGDFSSAPLALTVEK